MRTGAINHPKKDIYAEIAFMANNGFDFIDLTLEPPYGDDYDPIQIKERLSEFKLEVIGHTNPTLPVIYGIKSIQDDSFFELKKSADFFKKVGAKKVNIHPFYYSSHMDESDLFNANVTFLKKIIGYFNDIGLELMLENFKPPFHSPDNFQRVLDEVPDLKIHLDVGHLNIFCNSVGEATKEYFDKFGKKIIHIHLHDNFGEEDNHLPIGCGNIQWDAVLKIIKQARYNSTITLEVFSFDRDYLLISKRKLKEKWKKID